MKHHCSLTDKQYLQAFETHKLDPQQFHHRNHLRVAYTLLANNSFDCAFQKFKSGLLDLLQAHQLPVDKYHESKTYGWFLIIHFFMHKAQMSRSFDDFIGRYSMLLDPTLITHYYSEEQLNSEQAKTTCVEPDLQLIIIPVD